MAHSVTLLPSQRSFPIDDGETILAAALREGLALPYGCRDGACGACKGKVVDGSIDHGKAQPQALADADRRQGYALFCCATATSDLVLECREVGGLRDIPVKTLPTRVQKIERPAPDVAILQLRLPASERLQFLAGQYVDILLKDGRRRSFSIANAPHDDEFMQLHIRHIPGGAFTDHVFAGLKERDILRINGPLGSFHLHEESPRPIVLIAGGTGFAPIKAIVEHARSIGLDRPMHLYWGARNRAGLYLDELARAWATTPGAAAFTYVPVLSNADPADSRDCRTGLVHAAVMEDFADLSTYQVYACGSPAMIDAARRDLIESCGLPAEHFFADSFTYASDPVPA